MAAFLHEGSTGLGVKPVPVAHFLQKRKAVLPNGEHFDTASDSLNLLRKCRDGGHVAVFHGNPNRGRIVFLERFQLGQVGRISEQRLLHEDRKRVQLGDFDQLVEVTEIGAGDHQTV